MPDDTVLGPPADAGGDSDSGPGRVLVAIYAIFAVAAGSRATVQILTRFSTAPVAYLLSAFAAAVYLVATVGLARRGLGARRTALTAISVELAGVLAVGTFSLIDRAAFPDATVWSDYGRGYGFVPLALPVLGLLYLRSQRQDDGAPSPATTERDASG